MSFDASVLDAALAGLNSCVRCRSRRIGCDPSLPSCQPCIAAGAECELYDHILEANFSRSYVQSLHRRLQNLEGALRPHVQVEHLLSESQSTETVQISAPTKIVAPHNARGDHDPARSARNGTSNWGSSSAIGFFDFVCKALHVDGAAVPRINSASPMPATSEWLKSCYGDKAIKPPGTRYPTVNAAKELFQQYYFSIETFTPIIGRATGEADLVSFYAHLSEDPPRHSHTRTRSSFRAQMVLAIALRIMMDSEPGLESRSSPSQYAVASDAIFNAASSQLRNALVFPDRHSLSSRAPFNEPEREETLEKLRIVLLLVVYLALSPGSGNAWQILGFADRLIRRDPHPISFSGVEDSVYLMLYESFLILERLVGTAMGKHVGPLDLNETISSPKSIPSLMRHILGIKARLHIAHQASNSSLPNGKSLGNSLDFKDIDMEVAKWLSEYEDTVIAMQELEQYSSEPTQVWLLTIGRATADETKLLALCLLWQQTGFVHSPQSTQLADLEGIGQGQDLIISLLEHYDSLLKMKKVPANHLGVAQLIFPSTWIWAMHVFRLAVFIIFIGTVSRDTIPNLKLTTVLQLLEKGRLFDGSSLAKAAFVLNQG